MYEDMRTGPQHVFRIVGKTLRIYLPTYLIIIQPFCFIPNVIQNNSNSWILPKNERWGNIQYKIAPAFIFWKNLGQNIFFWDFLTFSNCVMPVLMMTNYSFKKIHSKWHKFLHADFKHSYKFSYRKKAESEGATYSIRYILKDLSSPCFYMFWQPCMVQKRMKKRQW